MLHLDNFSLPVAPHLLPSSKQIINFAASKGSISWIIGPTGSGKTSLLETLSLRRSISIKQTGTLRLFNHHIHSKISNTLSSLLKRHIGVIDSVPSLHPEWTSLENILLPLRLNGMRYSEMMAQARPLLQWLELSSYKNTSISKLSYAFQQRVMIARALINRPALLLVDLYYLEPTLQNQLLPAFSAMMHAGCTILLTMPNDTLVSALPAPILRLPIFPSSPATSLKANPSHNAYNNFSFHLF